MAKEVSENVKMLVERSTDSGTATAIENMKEEYVSILKEGKDPKYENVTKDSFPHIPDQLYAPTLISLEKARLHCRLQMIRIVKEVCTDERTYLLRLTAADFPYLIRSTPLRKTHRLPSMPIASDSS